MHHNHSTSFSASIQACTDLGYLETLAKTGNHRVRKLATAQINTFVNDVAHVVKATADRMYAAKKRAERAHKAEVKVKRSLAAKKAAATRAARKAAQTVSSAS